MSDAPAARMLMPPVSRYMTRHPYAIAPGAQLSTARALMSQHAIHHLPVIDDDRLVGILSERDARAPYASEDRVSEAMTYDVAVVAQATPIDEVVALMEAEQLGSVVIVGAAGVEGIFTQADAMRAFCDVLRRSEEGER